MIKKLLISTFAFIVLLVSPASVFAATLSTSPSSGTFNKGCFFNVDIVLDAAGVQTDGTDAIIIDDTARFSATSVTSGTIYPDYPGNNIDEVGEKLQFQGLLQLRHLFQDQEA